LRFGVRLSPAALVLLVRRVCQSHATDHSCNKLEINASHAGSFNLRYFYNSFASPEQLREQSGDDFVTGRCIGVAPANTNKNRNMKQLSSTFIGLAVAVSTLSAGAAVGTITGPFTHQNLQIFLVHGATQLEERRYATLSEALDRGIVIVKETGNVQELAIENVSKETTVFLNAGDIVKGGRQDRTVRDDLILPPLSGRVPLEAFCVEHGRWTKRGGEKDDVFSSNSNMLSSRKEKLAARYGVNQGEVWAGVHEQQLMLNDNVSRLAGKSVDTRSPASASSLQLTLENKDLDSVKKRYLEALNPILNGKTDVIGFVYGINGEINSVEVYNNKSLFRALWPKLMDSAITEAITEYQAMRSVQPVQMGDLKAFFETAVSGTVKERTVWKSTRVRTFTTPSTVLFETLDVDAGEV